VNWSAELVADVPAGVVTVTSTTPAVPAGLIAVIEVGETTVTPVAALAPKSTAVAPVKPVPVIVTSVPPAVVPEVGLTPETVGGEVEDAASASSMFGVVDPTVTDTGFAEPNEVSSLYHWET
jgi:hypothetical protein